MHWFIDPVQNHYADFTGRATRQEFWMFILGYAGIAIVVGIIARAVEIPVLSDILRLALAIPILAIGSRRLHDINKSGWWQIIAIIPLIGAIVLIVWLATKGEKGSNRYGESPQPEASHGDENIAPSVSGEEQASSAPAEETETAPEREEVEENKQEGFGN